jgi:hypothetical protein
MGLVEDDTVLSNLVQIAYLLTVLLSLFLATYSGDTISRLLVRVGKLTYNLYVTRKDYIGILKIGNRDLEKYLVMQDSWEYRL